MFLNATALSALYLSENGNKITATKSRYFYYIKNTKLIFVAKLRLFPG